MLQLSCGFGLDIACIETWLQPDIGRENHKRLQADRAAANGKLAQCKPQDTCRTSPLLELAISHILIDAYCTRKEPAGEAEVRLESRVNALPA